MLIGHLLKYQRPVNHEILVGDVLGKTNLVDGLAIDTIELTVAYRDIIDRIGKLGILVAHDHHAILRLLAGDILHRDIAHRGVVATTANLLRLIVGVDLEHCLATLSDGDVTHVDVLYHTTTATVRLDTQYRVEVGRVHHTVLGIDILAAATDL